MNNNYKKEPDNKFIYTNEDIAGIRLIKNDTIMLLHQQLLYMAENRHDGNIDVIFDTIAKTMIQHCALKAGNDLYYITEIEFYYSNGKEHADPFVHSEQYSVSRQSTLGEWYFHRYNSEKAYAHRRRAIDITFGSVSHKTSGGILIRGIKPCDGKTKPITGPGNVVAAIMSSLPPEGKDPALLQLATCTGNYVFTEKSPLRLIAQENIPAPLLKTKRYGLKAKEKDEQNIFLNKRYRYYDEQWLLTYLKGKEAAYQELVAAGTFEKGMSREKIGYMLRDEKA